MSEGLVDNIPDWLKQAKKSPDLTTLREELTMRICPHLQESLGRPWFPSGDADPYLRRAWSCVEYHERRFAETVCQSLTMVLDRLESGDLGYDRPQSNVLRDVCFAQALELKENAAAERFECDEMPRLRRIAQRVAGQRGVDVVDNFLAELILPRASRPARIASYQGKTSLQSWLAAVVSNFCMGKARARRETAQSDEVEPVAFPGIAIESRADATGCFDLLKPLLHQAVESVDAEDRLLLKMLILDEVPQQNVARALGIHSGNVTRRRQRAAERIWQQVQCQSNESHRGSRVRGCLELVLAGEDRELSMALGDVLARAMPDTDEDDEPRTGRLCHGDATEEATS